MQSFQQLYTAPTRNNVNNPTQRNMPHVPIKHVEVLAQESEAAKQATDHYSQLQDHGRTFRSERDAISLRKLNNWIKSVLIHLHSPKDPIVLDLCCGKGGDLMKWKAQKAVFVVMVDGAENSIHHAIARYNQLSSKGQGLPFTVHIAHLDAFRYRLRSIPNLYPDPSKPFFDIVSCQFSMHYAFENEQRVRALLTNVSDSLREGGVFLGTTPDSDVIMANAQLSPKERNHEFGNDSFKIRFPPNMSLQEYSSSSNVFGLVYYFHLQDAVVDCPEYLVHFATFEKLALEYDLELVLRANFHVFFAEMIKRPVFQDLLDDLGVFKETLQFPQDDWEIAYMYQVFAFRKRGTPSDRIVPMQIRTMDPRLLQPEDIFRVVS